jgi:hypothetical protein
MSNADVKELVKLVVFVPEDNADEVREALVGLEQVK